MAQKQADNTDSENLANVKGRLMKRDRTFHTWKWRQCCLKNGMLQVFSDKGNLKVTLVLTNLATFEIHLLKAPKPFGFTLYFDDNEKIQFCAESTDERSKWVSALVYQCPKAKIVEDFVSITTAKDEKKEKRIQAEVTRFPSINSSVPTTANRCNSFSSAFLVEYGPLREPFSRIIFPPTLSNGDFLCGVGSIVRRVRWANEKLLSVALYIEAQNAKLLLIDYYGQTIEDLVSNQDFFSGFIRSPFRKTFVISTHRRVSRSIITECLNEGLGSRLCTSQTALHAITSFIERSLRKGESMVMTCNPDDTLVFRYKGEEFPPIASRELCLAIQGMFFDSNSIQHDAKHALVVRIPSLWQKEACITEGKKIEDPGVLDELDDEEQEDLRRDSVSESMRFEPITDYENGHVFQGCLVNGSGLLGHSKRVYKTKESYLTLSIGFYADPLGISEALLRYKGLSVGSLQSDSQFFARLLGGFFSKTFVIHTSHDIKTIEFVNCLLGDIKSVLPACASLASRELEQFQLALTTYAEVWTSLDAIYITINPDGSMDLSVRELGRIEHHFSRSFANLIQNIYIGHHPVVPSCRSYLLQRLPLLLDQAKDDLVHTYSDEIEMLMENFRRQKPGTKVKVGYLYMLVGRRRGGVKWVKRWCRLDGTEFFYYNHKRKKNAREKIDLTACQVADRMHYHDAKLHDSKEATASSSSIIITKPTLDEIILRSDNVYEEAEWFELLIEASNVENQLVYDKSSSHIRTNEPPIDSLDGGSILQWISHDSKNQILMILLGLVVIMSSDFGPIFK